MLRDDWPELVKRAVPAEELGDRLVEKLAPLMDLLGAMRRAQTDMDTGNQSVGEAKKELGKILSQAKKLRGSVRLFDLGARLSPSRMIVELAANTKPLRAGSGPNRDDPFKELKIELDKIIPMLQVAIDSTFAPKNRPSDWFRDFAVRSISLVVGKELPQSHLRSSPFFKIVSQCCAALHLEVSGLSDVIERLQR